MQREHQNCHGLSVRRNRGTRRRVQPGMKGWCGRLIALAVAVAVAGCGSTSLGVSHSHRVGTAAKNELPLRHPLTPDQVARELINAARAPSGAVRSTTAPTKSLQNPPDLPEVSGVTVVHRWWRIAMPWHAAYAWVARHQPAFLSSGSSGASSGPALTNNEQNIDFTPPEVPQSVNSAILTIAVAPLTAHSSAIGAYAVVVRQPSRPAIENVPLTVKTVDVDARRNAGNPGNGPIISQRTVTGLEAETLVRDFDELSVDPPGVTSCPLSMETESATFRADGHTWVATTGICVGVDVSLDGQPLATLDTSMRFSRDLHSALGSPGSQVRQPMVRNTPIR